MVRAISKSKTIRRTEHHRYNIEKRNELGIKQEIEKERRQEK